MVLRVAGAQIPVSNDIDSNVETISRAIHYAQTVNADILLTPEGSLSGYTHIFDVQKTKDVLAYITDMAKSVNLALALGTCYMEDDGKVYNQIRFYDKDGTFLGFHTKILTCGSPTDPSVGEVNHFATRPLQTYQYGKLIIGGLICNDLWANPTVTPMPDIHLTQQLSEMGAKVIFHAVNGGRDDSEWSDVNWAFHESNLRMRARAGKLWIVTVDNCHPTNLRCASPSGVIDPDGNWVCRTNEMSEDYFVFDIPI